jgi:hypothetical protein
MSARWWVSRRIARALGGHVSLGPVTVYGRNAMHFAVNVHTKRWGYVCFRLPLRCFGMWWPVYFYCSPDGTPSAATFIVNYPPYSERTR